MMLCEKQHREEEKTKTVNMAFETQNKWKQSTGFVGWFDEIPQKSNTYTFRGPINITHLVNDCIRDGKHAFIAIGDMVVVGVSKQLGWTNTGIAFGLIESVVPKDSLFHLFKIAKKDIPQAIEFLKDIDKKIKKDIRVIAKQIAKDKKAGKFSNAPETKVLTF
jgi:hypothetical protein